MRALQVTSRADKDISECAAYIARDNSSAALKFLESVEEECQNLCRHPEIGSGKYGEIFPELGFVRFLPVSNFCSWLVFYVATPEELLVIRVINGKRDIPNLFP